MDKILRIDVGAEGGPKAVVTPVGEYAGLGGRAMTTTVVFKEVPPQCHPLGRENKLVISPGLLAGTAAPSSGRLSIGCKSPLTGTIKESNSGGTAGQALARMGYAAIIIEGERRGTDLYKVVITGEGVKIHKANELSMLSNYPLVEKLKAEYGDKTFITIGTAGEMRMSNSTICVTDPETRPTRHAGRGGVGAVMGSKGIKAIVVDMSGTKMRQAQDPDAFKAACRKFTEGLLRHPVTGGGLPTYGTNVLTNVLNEAGGYPTRNFTTGRFEGAAGVSGETMAENMKTRPNGVPTHGCHAGCVIRCSGIYTDKDGNYISKLPEYETSWAHGGNCGIDDADTIALMDRLDDDYGFDTIEMGCSIAVAMEAGLIPFGDIKGAINLIHEAGKGTPLGRIFGAGTATVARCFGLERAPVVKGQSMPAYDPRAVKGIGVTYATTTQGADHTAGYAVAPNILGVGGTVDPLSPVGQVQTSRDLQIATAALDATGYCLFVAFCILDQPESFQAMIDTINAMYGLKLDANGVVDLGKSILRMEREFNTNAGFNKAHDRLPMYFSHEKLAPHGVVFDVPDKELDELFNF